jgi:hypothetical protein
MTTALEGVGGQHHTLAALTLGKTRYTLCRRLGGPQGRSGRVRKISPPPGFFFNLYVSCASLFWYWTFNGRLYRIVLHSVDFSSRKYPTASVGSEPAILGTRGQQDSIPGPSSPLPVAIPTEISRFPKYNLQDENLNTSFCPLCTVQPWCILGA